MENAVQVSMKTCTHVEDRRSGLINAVFSVNYSVNKQFVNY